MKPSQADFDKVYRLILQPLAALFNVRLSEAMIDAYVEELAPFDEETLKKAIKALRREYKRAPTLAVVIEKCRFFMPVPVVSVRGTYPWEEKEKARTKMVDDFMADFSNSDVMREARVYGYEQKAYQYAKNVATMQACRILGIEGGFDGCIYDWDMRYVGEVVDRRIEEVKRHCDEQAELGVIEVKIPQEAIEAWKKLNTHN